jgi:hypothetical protein
MTPVPVIVGVGVHREPSLDPRECSEPVQAMAHAGRDDLYLLAESISVPRGL